MAKKLVTLLIVALILCSVWHVGGAVKIYAKACLAQALLERAWQRTLKGEKKVRPWPWADTWPIAELSVPRLGIRQIVLSGDSGRVLAFSPGHTQASATPGKPGVTVISGHRDTSFNFLQKIKSNDRVRLKTYSGSYVYVVNELSVVDQRDFQLDPLASNPSLMLVTCYPFDALRSGGNERFLVFATLANHDAL